MGQLRYWMAAIVLWMFVFGSVERLHAPLSIVPVVYALAIGTAVACVLWRWLRRQSPLLVGGGLLVVLIVLKVLLRYPVVGSHLPVTITEGSALLITLTLAWQAAKSIDRFEQAATDALMMELDNRLSSFDIGQEEIYREIRRARQFERPLSLVAIAPTERSVKHSFHRFIEEAHRKAIEKYIYGRVADLLSRRTNHCDLIARRNNHFIVLLPETDRDRAKDILIRLQRSVEEELGLKVRTGTATFPDEEITFTGLLERAEAEMQSDEFEFVSQS